MLELPGRGPRRASGFWTPIPESPGPLRALPVPCSAAGSSEWTTAWAASRNSKSTAGRAPTRIDSTQPHSNPGVTILCARDPDAVWSFQKPTWRLVAHGELPGPYHGRPPWSSSHLPTSSDESECHRHPLTLCAPPHGEPLRRWRSVVRLWSQKGLSISLMVYLQLNEHERSHYRQVCAPLVAVLVVLGFLLNFEISKQIQTSLVTRQRILW